jgi:hypothetical protein
VTVREHIYPIPDDAELDQMVGAATPHFALQIRDRVAALAATLPPDHPRQEMLTAHIARLEALAVGGEAGSEGQAELPNRPSLALPGSPATGGGSHDG